MSRKMIPAVLAGVLGVVVWFGFAAPARAQFYANPPVYQPLNRFYYYPYYYFPANYWPSMGPKWPEPVGAPYMRPPAYMAYPPFKEPHWRYEYWMPQIYHRGSHFWLDQF
jgi:hypothetical protein